MQHTMEIMSKRGLSISKIAFLDILSYKMNIISIIASHFLDLGLSLLLWKVILGNGKTIMGYSDTVMYVYMALAVVLNAFFNTPRRLSTNISRDIIDGNIATKLLYPVDYYQYYLWYCIGRGFFFFVFVSVPLLLVSSIIVWQGMVPNNLLTSIFFVISIVLGYFVETGMALLIASLLFWTEKSAGIISMATFLAYLFSGRLIPLDFFPEWLKIIADILPYKYTIYAPISIYLGREHCLYIILLQFLWIVILTIIGRLMFKKAYERVEVAGG